MAEEKIALSREEYIVRQIKQALGADNKYYCWQQIGHSPDENEALLYYVESGGATHFAEQYIPEEAIETESVEETTEKP